MTRLLLSFIIILTTLLPCAAQGKGNAGHEQMRKELLDFKVKYLMQEINLAADKQPEFERLYRQMEAERHNLFKNIPAKVDAVAKNADASDAELLSTADAMAALKQREGALEMNYFQQFKKMLTPRQAFELKRAEQKFNRKVMEMRGRRHKSKTPKNKR